MTVLTLVRSELRRLTSTRLGVLAFVALMFVPLLYGGLYLWGNQDPYGNLKKVPAGLVVADTGAVVDGAAVHYGRSVARSLERGHEFDWVELTPAAAADEIRTGGVDFVVTLPATFSRDLASAGDTVPKQAQVQLATNDANSYLSSTIAGQAATAIRASVAEQVGTSAAKRFLVGLSTVRGRLTDASSGAATLATGAAKSATGASTLAAGTKQVASGASSLAGGLDSLRSATGELPAQAAALASGAKQVSSGAGSVRSGASRLANGADRLSSGASDLSGGASRLASGTESLSAGLGRIDAGSAATASALAAQLRADGLSDAQVQRALAVLAPGAAAVHTAASSSTTLVSGTRSLASSATQLSRGAGTLSSGASSLASGAGSLASGASRLAAGTARLDTAAPALAKGIATADSGARALAAGASKTASGASSLASGTSSLASGAHRLSTGLASGVRSIPATTAAERTRQAAAIGNPAAVATTKVTSAGTYGAGLAPFFLSLAAWIGSYALFLILRPLSRRAITAVRQPLAVALAGWLTPALLGVAQMVALFCIATGVLGFSVVHPLGMLGMLALTAATFAAILLLLNAALGSVGQFLGLILMLVQLVTAGGTFPWQTLPEPLAALHHALPMAYAVDGLRQVMYGGDLGLALGDAGVLAIWLLAALSLTAAVAARMTRRRTLRDLQPSLLGG